MDCVHQRSTLCWNNIIEKCQPRIYTRCRLRHRFFLPPTLPTGSLLPRSCHSEKCKPQGRSIHRFKTAGCLSNSWDRYSSSNNSIGLKLYIYIYIIDIPRDWDYKYIYILVIHIPLKCLFFSYVKVSTKTVEFPLLISTTRHRESPLLSGGSEDLVLVHLGGCTSSQIP